MAPRQTLTPRFDGPGPKYYEDKYDLSSSPEPEPDFPVPFRDCDEWTCDKTSVDGLCGYCDRCHIHCTCGDYEGGEPYDEDPEPDIDW